MQNDDNTYMRRHPFYWIDVNPTSDNQPKTIRMKLLNAKCTGIVFALLGFTLSASATEMRLNGSTAVTASLVKPYKEAVEKSTGITLNVVGTSVGKGFAALLDGSCDMAMNAEPLETAAESLKKAGKSVNIADYQFHIIKQDLIVFVVHPSNPVNELTMEQAKDIHTGKIINWKEVGGADLPIMVFADGPTGGLHARLIKVICKGEPLGPKVRELESLRLIGTQVSEFKNAVGCTSISFIDPKIVKVLKTEEITRPLGFITKGAPTPDMQKVIDAYKAAVETK
ncbi:MAG: substrate-binding domain-containing protein [Verrucomicrobiota bacterium]|nr:substrate-binding domain-containing protein [Verrucomicrobiota bacterium]